MRNNSLCTGKKLLLHSEPYNGKKYRNHRNAGGNSSATYPDGREEREFNHVSKAHDSKKQLSSQQSQKLRSKLSYLNTTL